MGPRKLEFPIERCGAWCGPTARRIRSEGTRVHALAPACRGLDIARWIRKKPQDGGRHAAIDPDVERLAVSPFKRGGRHAEIQHGGVAVRLNPLALWCLVLAVLGVVWWEGMSKETSLVVFVVAMAFGLLGDELLRVREVVNELKDEVSSLKKH